MRRLPPTWLARTRRLLDGAQSAAERLAEDLPGGVAATDAAAAAAALGGVGRRASKAERRAMRRARPPNVTVETHADDAALRW